MAPNLTAIAREFDFSDNERDLKLGGEISLYFFLVGGLCGFFFGYLSDSHRNVIPRTKLFAFVVILGEIGCIGTYLSKSYSELLFYRITTGISIGGTSPIIYSILGDIWPSSARTYISTIVGLSMAIGAAVGQIISAFTGPAYGWRFPFIVVAIPALFCAFLLMIHELSPSLRVSTSVLENSKNNDSNDNFQEMENQNDYLEDSLHPLLVPVPISNIDESSYNSDQVGMRSPSREKTPPSTPLERERAVENVDVLPSYLNTSDAGSIGNHAFSTSLLPTGSGLGILSKIFSGQWYLLCSTKEMKNVCTSIIDMFACKTAMCIYLQGVFGCIPWSIIGVFLNDYLSHDMHMSIRRSTIVMACFGVGAMAGQSIGGYLGQRLYNIDPRHQCLLMGLSSTLGTFPMLCIINYKEKETEEITFYLFFVIGGFLAAITGPNVRSILQNVTTPETRGKNFALFALCDDVGKGGGPFLISQMIVLFDSRKQAFNFGLLSWLLCGGFCFLMYFTILDDLKDGKHRAVNSHSGNAMNDIKSSSNGSATNYQMNNSGSKSSSKIAP